MTSVRTDSPSPLDSRVFQVEYAVFRALDANGNFGSTFDNVVKDAGEFMAEEKWTPPALDEDEVKVALDAMRDRTFHIGALYYSALYAPFDWQTAAGNTPPLPSPVPPTPQTPEPTPSAPSTPIKARHTKFKRAASARRGRSLGRGRSGRGGDGACRRLVV